jgi:hypothetical protein
MPAATEAFFAFGGRQRVAQEDLIPAPSVSGTIARVLDVAGAADWQRARHNVYVVELRSVVFNDQRFLAKNLHYVPGTKPCVYVGMTGRSPEERLHHHWQGDKSAFYVRAHGLRLLPDLYEHYNPMPWELAGEVESLLAEHLREQGYGVWQA